MDSFLSDFSYAFRVFFKRPGLTILAIVALSVSLGMSTTAFSTLNGMFFKPLPFKDPANLHALYLRNEKSDMKKLPIPYEHFGDLTTLNCFSETMAYYTGTINISGKGLPKRYNGGYVSANFLDVLGETPLLGKSFSPVPQTDAPGEVLISHSVWQKQFLGDPHIVGTPIRANGTDHIIVGVLKDGFHFPKSEQIWVPLRSHLFTGESPHLSQVYAIGRIARGSTPEMAQEEMNQVFSSWTNITMEDTEGTQLTCAPVGRMEMNKASESLIVAAIGAVIFVLLVSCANVANLLVGRAMSRGREMAIRSAVGATRGRIVRQLLTESLVLSFFGAVGGLLYAAWAVDASMNYSTYEIPYWMSFELDWRVFVFALLVMIGTALVSGLIPAWQSSKINLNEMLKDTSHTSTSFRLGKMTRLLAVVQIAFSCALLFGAGLITRNVYKMAHVDPGYDGSAFLTMRMGLFAADYPTESDRDAFFEKLIHKVSQVPGVESAAVTSWLAQYGNFRQPIILANENSEKLQFAYAYAEAVSPGYFSTFDINPVKGTLFENQPGAASQRVAVVNQTFADEHFPGTNPVGQQIARLMEKSPDGADKTEQFTITGVVPSIRVSDFTKPEHPEAIIYVPYTQSDSRFMSLVVRSHTDDMEELQTAIQNVILTIDPNLPVYFTKTMAEYLDEQIYPFRMLANFFLSIGLMALFLAAIGVYGMLAFNVSRRRREIGIRMALGATTMGIVRQVLQQGLIQLVLGLVVGTGLAYVVGQLTRGFLFGVNPVDPSVYIGVLLTLIGVATLSFFIPARRAANLSPMDALRYE